VAQLSSITPCISGEDKDNDVECMSRGESSKEGKGQADMTNKSAFSTPEQSERRSRTPVRTWVGEMQVLVKKLDTGQIRGNFFQDPTILSLFKSFTTIYRPIVIQPHRNQTI
jgi:hypothetical protein